MCKQLGFVAILVVDIVPEGVEGSYSGVVISGCRCGPKPSGKVLVRAC